MIYTVQEGEWINVAEVKDLEKAKLHYPNWTFTKGITEEWWRHHEVFMKEHPDSKHEDN